MRRVTIRLSIAVLYSEGPDRPVHTRTPVGQQTAERLLEACERLATGGGVAL